MEENPLNQAIGRLTCQDLRRVLRRSGSPVYGNKSTLLGRLNEVLGAGESSWIIGVIFEIVAGKEKIHNDMSSAIENVVRDPRAVMNSNSAVPGYQLPINPGTDILPTRNEESKADEAFDAEQWLNAILKVPQQRKPRSSNKAKMVSFEEDAIKFYPLIWHEITKILIAPQELKSPNISVLSKGRPPIILQSMRFELKLENCEKEMLQRSLQLPKNATSALSSTHVSLRFGVLTIPGVVEECLPPVVKLWLNDIELILDYNACDPLPERLTSSRPVDITNHLDLRPDASNVMIVSWSNRELIPDQIQRSYGICAYIRRNARVADLVDQVKKLPRFPLEKSICQSRILSKLSMGQKNRISLLCPLTNSRIQLPAKGVLCAHFECFDLENYLQHALCNFKMKMQCPICNVFMRLEDLRIDELYADFVARAEDANMDFVLVNGDGEPISY